jgi:acylphosphatase
LQRLHLFVRGKVQGVFYRSDARERAQQLGLRGWVRNRLDGSVELVAEGPAEQLRALEVWCKDGPPGAVVDGIDQLIGEATGEFTAFAIRPDA